MNKRFWAILFGVGLLLAAILITYTMGGSVTPVNARSNEVLVKAGTPTSKDEQIIQEVNDLVNDWTGSYLRSGWLHVVEKHESGLESRGVLPNNQPLPPDYIKDGWYQLNDQGLVVQAVISQYDLQGSLFQQSIYTGGIGFNLTTDESMAREPYRLKVDFGFSESVAQPEWYTSLHRREDTDGDRSTLLFAIREEYDQPMESADEKGLASATETRAEFDPLSGSLLSYSVVEIGADGEEFEVFLASIQTIEKADPPQEVLDVLDKVEK